MAAYRSESQKIVDMCWESYVRLVSRIVCGTATEETWKELDKLLLEDWNDHCEVALGGRPYLLESLLWRMLNLVVSRQWEDALYTAIESGAIWNRLLEMRIWEKDCPELAEAGSMAGEEKAKRVQRLLKKWVSALHDGELYHFVYEDFLNGMVPAVRRRRAAFYEHVQKRCMLIKEELMAVAWAPSRVERWLEAGICLDSV